MAQGAGMIELLFSRNRVRGGSVGDHLLLVSRQVDSGCLSRLLGILAVSALRNGFSEEVVERGLEGGEFDPVLGSFWAGHAGFYCCEVEFHHRGEGKGILLGRDAEEALGAVVVLD